MGVRRAVAGEPGRRRGQAAMAVWLWLGALVAPWGCAGHTVIDPVVDIEGRRLVVLPFAEAQLARYDSVRGNELARRIAERLLELRRVQGEDEVVDVVRFEDLVAAVREVDPRTLAPAAIGARTGADLVLLGEIVEYRTRLPGDVGLLRGRAEVELRVLDLRAGSQRPVFASRLRVVYPPEDGSGAGVLASGEADEAVIERGLQAALVRRIAELFTYHEVAWMER
ncbi:MAG: hypothetical protein KatS3mg102_1613 [Planctomycetota bacterium]|nr:MAG: hypothetical protein KatS3mg102_1613 [Planctomycetota bacterium]